MALALTSLPPPLPSPPTSPPPSLAVTNDSPSNHGGFIHGTRL